MAVQIHSHRGGCLPLACQPVHMMPWCAIFTITSLVWGKVLTQMEKRQLPWKESREKGPLCQTVFLANLVQFICKWFFWLQLIRKKRRKVALQEQLCVGGHCSYNILNLWNTLSELWPCKNRPNWFLNFFNFFNQHQFNIWVVMITNTWILIFSHWTWAVQKFYFPPQVTSRFHPLFFRC